MHVQVTVQSLNEKKILSKLYRQIYGFVPGIKQTLNFSRDWCSILRYKIGSNIQYDIDVSCDLFSHGQIGLFRYIEKYETVDKKYY